MRDFEAIVEQTRWAVSKAVSYSDFLSAAEYLQKAVTLDRIEAAFLLDDGAQCLAYAASSHENGRGCSAFSSEKLTLYRNSSNFLLRETPFFFPVLGGSNTIQARLFVVSDVRFLHAAQHRFMFYSGLLVAGLLTASFFIAHRIFRTFRGEIMSLRECVRDLVTRNAEWPRQRKFMLYESRDIETTVLAVGRELDRLQAELVAKERTVLKGELAAQVAHDIRSPLAALSAVVSVGDNIPEASRHLIRSAVTRITDIANDLRKGSPIAEASKQEALERQVYHVASMIDDVLSEKRLQYSVCAGVEIGSRIAADGYRLFASVDAGQFRRVISNLIDNAVEALDDKGKVTVELVGNVGGLIHIYVSDNGRGIPNSLLNKVGQKGFTLGKKSGSGLGLYHARTTIGHFGGSVSIKSDEVRGTEVTVSIPSCVPPLWFVPEVRIPRQGTVLFLDDEQTVHDAWQLRIRNTFPEQHFQMLHLKTGREFREHVRTALERKPTLFLVDHELLGEQDTGLDLIAEFDISERSILVTNKYEDTQIIRRCLDMNLRLLPKVFLLAVPIQLTDTHERTTKIGQIVDDHSVGEAIGDKLFRS
ncbi:MAG TPA: HAMP domain-containing sensor histidine kinase [Bdellovibrionota bacterium]|nr:HAMP domain-containing sensor histidine kinase [Bdellovibrionota bacterium]